MFEIPQEKLPDFAKQEENLNVLFAPIRSRTVNPKDWDHKITCWKLLIKLYCECNDVYSFSLSSLNAIFIRHGRPPVCLKEVLQDMANNNEIQPLHSFLKKSPESWTGWASDTLFVRPVSWSFNKIKTSVFSNSGVVTETYVPLDVVKTQSEKLFKSVPDNFRNKLVSLKQLLNFLGKDSGYIENLKLLLHYLHMQQTVDVKQIETNKIIDKEVDMFLIKFGEGAKVSKITDMDIGIYTLEENEKVISKHIESIEEEIDQCVKEAKGHLSKKHKQMAKSCLVKKHQLEKRLEKKANALHNVQLLIEQIKNTHSDAHVWDAYKNALTAFNTSYKETGLNEDAVEDTMIKLGEMLDINEDIQTALSRPAKDDDTLDLEEELEELMKNDNGPSGENSDNELENRFEKLKLNIPSPPKESPNVSFETAIFN